MAVKWLLGMAMLYVILIIVSGIGEGTYLGTSGVATIWEAMTAFRAVDVTNPLTAISGVLILVWQLLVGIFEMLTWKFSFFVGIWAIFRWLLCAISLGIIVSLILTIRGVSSG